MEVTILILGSARVGKHCYLSRLVTGEFSARVRGCPSIMFHTVNTNLGKVIVSYTISSSLVDGYSKYIFMYDSSRPVVNMMLRASSVAVVVATKCDNGITVRSSDWYSYIWRKC